MEVRAYPERLDLFNIICIRRDFTYMLRYDKINDGFDKRHLTPMAIEVADVTGWNTAHWKKQARHSVRYKVVAKYSKARNWVIDIMFLNVNNKKH